MTVISGKDGYVNGVPCTTSWSVSQVAAIQAYAASCTDGGTGVVEGNINWTGTMAGLGPNPPVIPGQEFTFRGIADATIGSVIAIEGTVLIENVSIQFPVQGGGPIVWTATFGAQGLMTSSVTGAADNTSQLAVSAKDAEVEIDPATTAQIIENVQSIALAFSASSVTYVNDGVTYRKSGNLSANLSFDVLNGDLFVAGYQPNERHEVHVNIGDGTFWEIDEVVFGGLSNFNVNVATRAIVGYSVSGQWSAVTDADLKGKLTMPDGTVWFPLS